MQTRSTPNETPATGGDSTNHENHENHENPTQHRVEIEYAVTAMWPKYVEDRYLGDDKIGFTGGDLGIVGDPFFLGDGLIQPIARDSLEINVNVCIGRGESARSLKLTRKDLEVRFSPGKLAEFKFYLPAELVY
jgi:hypothetical protein